jgi:folate-binding protein YgfZ
MAELHYALSPERGCLLLEGEEARGFLQGLVSNDVQKVSATHALYAAFLTAQGRFLHDLFIAEVAESRHAGNLVLDGEASRLDDLRRRLSIYKLRAKVTISDAREALAVAVLWGEGACAALGLPNEPGIARPLAGGTVFVDPRLAALGCRAILPRPDIARALGSAGFVAAPFAEHRRLRLSLGVPEGSADLPVEKALLLENGFAELNGVDFQKGCYLGQEVTARMKYRALVKKCLLPVTVEGPLPEPGTPVFKGSEEIGEMRSSADGVGLALLAREAADAAIATGEHLKAADAVLHPRRPHWLAD